MRCYQAIRGGDTDPRDPRPLATARLEQLWIASDGDREWRAVPWAHVAE